MRPRTVLYSPAELEILQRQAEYRLVHGKPLHACASSAQRELDELRASASMLDEHGIPPKRSWNAIMSKIQKLYLAKETR